MRVLLIEDDSGVADYIVKGLRESGYQVEHAADGKQGLILATSENFDALVVDRMLPNVDGLTIIQTLRAANDTTPALILSALGEVDDRVKGLKAGGDDYLVKPFAFAELLARVRALLRRGGPSRPDRLIYEDLELDRVAHQAQRRGKKLDLTPKEFQLLEYLMLHPERVVRRTELLEKVWDLSFDPMSNVVDVHVGHLRRKLRGPEEDPDPLVHTVRGVGYVLKSDPP